MDLQLPFDQTVIQKILPHRYPFLLVDRITEFEADKRIVGIKNVSRNETYLWEEPGRVPTMPFTILTEAVRVQHFDGHHLHVVKAGARDTEGIIGPGGDDAG